ncbi:MAG: carboxypeptidase-like regulatory domain-containing protein [Bacteroidota bacterium]|nr:carboxypeptidase-like regulatory domain-containing protein [Bacteroidota bacterium]
MIRLSFIGIIIFFSSFAYAQTEIRGTVKDASTGELLIGATVVYGKGQGVSTDLDGNFSFLIQPGTRNLTVSYVGYKATNKLIEIPDQRTPIIVDFKLETKLLSEVQVVADIAIDRETPVAFSTVSVKKINEELASQDIPMLLNSTPGVYATQSGGGDGDARITIRGFNQRNVAVMIDGIPVNDMENGWVYWSNWFGLDAVTSNIQVQRGLGASKIAIPSVGGTMNILTKGTGNKKAGILKQEIGSFGKLRTTVGYNSGRLQNGWGYTVAGSYKQGDGFVDQTWTNGYFYYAKIQKELGNHILSLSVMGAPQKHGQRSEQSDIMTYDLDIARELGDDSPLGGWTRDPVTGDTVFINRTINKGITHNKHWSDLDRWRLDSNGDTIHAYEILNTRQNYYHKPQFALRDFWTVNDRLQISNIIYASIGNGGGTRLSGADAYTYDSNGRVILQQIYNKNKLYDPNGEEAFYHAYETESETYLRSSINNHYWYGGLSTLNAKLNDKFTFSGGIDLRYYKGEHYAIVYDLLGGDYIQNENNALSNNTILNEGDKTGYHNDGLVKWVGIFSQLEYSTSRLSYFFNLSASNSAYKRIDYFKKKDLVLDDTTYIEGLGMLDIYTINFDENGNLIYPVIERVPDTIFHNGKAYTVNSNAAQYTQTDWKWMRGYTIKTGANYNLDEKNNVFLNLGRISKAPRFNNVYDYSNKVVNDIQNENIKAVELGYGYRSRLLSINTNIYHTIWENKPVNNKPKIYTQDGDVFSANINGINALHKGIEFDFAFRLTPKITIEGLASLGDWKWTSGDSVVFYDENNNIAIDDNGDTINIVFDANGVHVGDAAQTQFGLSLRYAPTKSSYIKLRGTSFSNYYSDFEPSSLRGENEGRESWKIPAYEIVDLHCGYKLNITKESTLDLRLSVLNLLNKTYIADAQNNHPYTRGAVSFNAPDGENYQDFDAKSAGVYFGSLRRINFSTTLTF